MPSRFQAALGIERVGNECPPYACLLGYVAQSCTRLVMQATLAIGQNLVVWELLDLLL